MAFIAPGQGGYNGPRMAAAPIAHASPESFGAAAGRDMQELGRMGLAAGLDVLAKAQEQQKKCDTAVAKNAVNQARIEMLEGSEKIMQERGANAQNARAEMNDLFDSVNRKYGAAIAGGNIELQGMYNDSMQGMRQTYDLAGARHQNRQMREYEEAVYRNGNAVEDAEIASIFSGRGALSGDGTQEMEATPQGETLPPIHPGDEMAKRINMRRENIALRFAGYPAGYIKQMQDDEEMRMHGVALAALSETSPRAALEYLEMPEVQAVVPPKEWRKTREKVVGLIVKDENRQLANNLGEQYDNESDLPDAIDEVMPNESAERKETVRKLSAAQIRNKRSARSRDRKALDESALKTMRESGWDVNKIDPNWPEDLQEKMLDRAEKREAVENKRMEQQKRDEQKARGLEYLKLSPDELDKKILNGEWISMMEDVGGETTDEGKKLRALANRDNANSDAVVGGSGGRTMLEYAASEYERLVGNPRSKKGKGDFAKFIGRVDEDRSQLAAELGVSPRLIPNSKQKEIIDKWLMNGDWRWFEGMPGPLSRNRRRYLVSEEDMSSWKPFEPATGADAAASKEEALPEFARQYFGPRDRTRELLPDGSVMIESSNGTVSIIKPDGSIEDGQ